MSTKKPIFVTKPFLPPLKEFLPYLESIWDKKILTNGGPMHKEFESKLCEYLEIEHISLFTNGTIALVTALQSLRITGEVITTPYSFVATAHSLLWNGITPVFVDIDPKSLNIDPNKIEAAITPRTTAIMPVHCYGSPCDMEKIEAIADNYNLKVIYDAAHAFGVKKNNKTILSNGDLSVLSFHATKIFNTFEGGAIVSPDAKTKQRIDHLKNFGFVNETTVVAAGINGKMSEFNAALGLIQLKYIDEIIQKRKKIAQKYFSAINEIKGISTVIDTNNSTTNFSYFPILIEDSYPMSRDDLYEKFKIENIHCRRYFYPLISSFPMYRNLPNNIEKATPIAQKISNQVLCLPIYPDLEDSEIERIIDLLTNIQ